MRRLILAVTVVALAGIWSSGASAASWDPPHSIMPLVAPGADESTWPAGLVTRQDEAGDVVVAWTEQIGGRPTTDVEHVELAFKPAGGAWTSAERIGTAGSVLADVEMDASGDVTVAYATFPPGLDGADGLYVVTRAHDGTYGQAQTLQAPVDTFTRAGLIGLGVDDAGDVLVVYLPDDRQPWSDFRPAGGAWQAPTPLQSVPYNGGIGVEGLVISPDGNALILESALAPDLDLQPLLAERRFSPASGWSAAVPISAPPGVGLGPDTLVLPTGEIVAFKVSVALTSESAASTTIEAASLAPGATTWSDFVPITTAPESDLVLQLELATDDAGEIILTYTEQPEAGLATGHSMVTIRSAGGEWAQPQELATSVGGTSAPMLGVAGDGRAVIGALVNLTDPDHPFGTALFEREPGSAAWVPMASPFAPAFLAQLSGGRGHELVALARALTSAPGQLTSFSVSASLLTTASSRVTPAAVVPPATTEPTGVPPVAKTLRSAASTSPKAAAARVTVAVVGKGTCRSARTPCRTARAVRLALKPPKGATHVRVTVQRLRAGRWRGLRVLVLRPINGKVRVTLPPGRLRIATSPAHDSLPHAWVAYLIVH